MLIELIFQVAKSYLVCFKLPFRVSISISCLKVFFRTTLTTTSKRSLINFSSTVHAVTHTKAISTSWFSMPRKLFQFHLLNEMSLKCEFYRQSDSKHQLVKFARTLSRVNFVFSVVIHRGTLNSLELNP